MAPAKGKNSSTAVTRNTRNSAKENPPTTNVTVKSSTQVAKPVNRSLPLQTRTPSSHDVDDTELAILRARVMKQQGLSVYLCTHSNLTHFPSAELDKLKKSQAAQPIETKLKEIRRPKKIANLQHAMGLTNNKKMYTYCRVSSFSLLLDNFYHSILTGNCSRCCGSIGFNGWR